jgi:hypothetical protein
MRAVTHAVYPCNVQQYTGGPELLPGSAGYKVGERSARTRPDGSPLVTLGSPQ